MESEDFLVTRLLRRKGENAFRELKIGVGLVDFCSNDYLGIVHNSLLVRHEGASGSTGSRLLAGNYSLVCEAEKMLAGFHNAEAGLIYNSGYDANVGLFSCVPQKGDTIIYDALSHASIRDGIRLSFAHSYSFVHNDIEDLERKISHSTGKVFIVTESVFSMDGDICPLKDLLDVCQKFKAYLIVDEAHATGIIGPRGEGLVQSMGMEDDIFCRVHTFGKACGCHGAVVLGSQRLKEYLVNFSRSFIYTTALPPSAIRTIMESYQVFPKLNKERAQLQLLIKNFNKSELHFEKLISPTPVQAVIIPGNENVKRKASEIQQSNFDVRPILYPSVQKGKERLRIVLHAFNTLEQLDNLIRML